MLQNILIVLKQCQNNLTWAYMRAEVDRKEALQITNFLSVSSEGLNGFLVFSVF